MLPWQRRDHAPSVRPLWKLAEPVTGQTPWRPDFLTALPCCGFWWLMTPSEQSRQCTPRQLEAVHPSLAPSAETDTCRCRNHLQSWTGSDTENESRWKRRRRRNMPNSDWRGRWMSTAGEPRRMQPFLKRMGEMLRTNIAGRSSICNMQIFAGYYPKKAMQIWSLIIKKPRKINLKCLNLCLSSLIFIITICIHIWNLLETGQKQHPKLHTFCF